MYVRISPPLPIAFCSPQSQNTTSTTWIQCMIFFLNNTHAKLEAVLVLRSLFPFCVHVGNRQRNTDTDPLVIIFTPVPPGIGNTWESVIHAMNELRCVYLTALKYEPFCSHMYARTLVYSRTLAYQLYCFSVPYSPFCATSSPDACFYQRRLSRRIV